MDNKCCVLNVISSAQKFVFIRVVLSISSNYKIFRISGLSKKNSHLNAFIFFVSGSTI